jgi:L-aspartate oxidase
MASKCEIYDVIIVGSGISGLSAAVKAAQKGARVCVLGKEDRLSECNTNYAQGGIVSKGESGDEPGLLERDILVAGEYLNNLEAVRVVCEEGPELVESFLRDAVGVPFCRNDKGDMDRTREAAHSARRIYHVKDRTGAEIEKALLDYARASERITFYPSCMAIDIITNTHHSSDSQERYKPTRSLGVYAWMASSGEVTPFFASSVILASGGVGNLFLHTSNPPGATGDGIAMASRAGAQIINAEYVQFHPTVLFNPDVTRFLISEALRGEGAKLMNRKGEYFMARYQPGLKDLAPRDQVARAIFLEMESQGSPYVLLDTKCMKVDPAERFPTIYATCASIGVDIRNEPIPVVPAAHYFCGGVKTDLYGRTTLPGLYAAGETACNGIHGANRLASVSLLEAMVFGLRAGADAASGLELPGSLVRSIPDWQYPSREEPVDPILLDHDLQNIQTTMWDYAGILRTRKRLARAIADLNYMDHRIESFYREAELTKRLIELRNAVLAAGLIARAAQSNPVSLGCHYVR